MPANEAKSASDTAVLNSASVPVIVFVFKLIDLLVNVSVEDSVTTELSISKVIVLPDTLEVRPVPPAIFNVWPKLTEEVEELSSAIVIDEFVNDEFPIFDIVLSEPLIVLFVNVLEDEIVGTTIPSTAKTPADERDNVVSEAWPRSKVDKVVIAPVEPSTIKLVLSTVIPPLAARTPAIVALPFDSKFILVKLRLVPVAAPIFGVTSVGVFANTNEPVPVSSEIAVANSADVPVKVFVVKLIDLFVKVSVEDSVTTVLSISKVIVSPEIDEVIPVPPAILSVSEPKVIFAVVEVSSEIVNVVEIFCVEALVILPCWSIAITGIAVEEPYVFGVTAVSSKSILTVSPEIVVVMPVSPEIFNDSPKLIVVVDEVSSTKVIEELSKDELAMFDIVLLAPLIVLFVNVSVVALATKVSVDVGKVKVPELEIDEIIGVVKVLFVNVSVVALPTKVSVEVGKVNVPLLLIEEIIGVVKVLFVNVCVSVKVTTVLSMSKVIVEPEAVEVNPVPPEILTDWLVGTVITVEESSTKVKFALTSAKLKTPEPSTCKNWPFVPAAAGKVIVWDVATSLGDFKATKLEPLFVPSLNLIVPPVEALFPIKSSSMALFESTRIAEEAVKVPSAWSVKFVKYLPPMTSILAAAPSVSVPVPIKRRSPLFPCVPTPYV